jgi:hypothetical protein
MLVGCNCGVEFTGTAGILFVTANNHQDVLVWKYASLEFESAFFALSTPAAAPLSCRVSLELESVTPTHSLLLLLCIFSVELSIARNTSSLNYTQQPCIPESRTGYHTLLYSQFLFILVRVLWLPQKIAKHIGTLRSLMD